VTRLIIIVIGLGDRGLINCGQLKEVWWVFRIFEISPQRRILVMTDYFLQGN
jgi:hypothetical protein